MLCIENNLNGIDNQLFNELKNVGDFKYVKASNSDILGVGLKTTHNKKPNVRGHNWPIYVSIGHRIGLENALKIIYTCLDQYELTRAPVPLDYVYHKTKNIMMKYAKESQDDYYNQGHEFNRENDRFNRLKYDAKFSTKDKAAENNENGGPQIEGQNKGNNKNNVNNINNDDDDAKNIDNNDDNDDIMNNDDLFSLFFKKNFGDKMWNKYGDNIINICDDIETIIDSDDDLINEILVELNITNKLQQNMFKRKVKKIKDQTKEFTLILTEIGLKRQMKQKLISIGIFSIYSFEYICNGKYNILLNLMGKHNDALLKKLWNKVYTVQPNTIIPPKNNGDNTIDVLKNDELQQSKSVTLIGAINDETLFDVDEGGEGAPAKEGFIPRHTNGFY